MISNAVFRNGHCCGDQIIRINRDMQRSYNTSVYNDVYTLTAIKLFFFNIFKCKRRIQTLRSFVDKILIQWYFRSYCTSFLIANASDGDVYNSLISNRAGLKLILRNCDIEMEKYSCRKSDEYTELSSVSARGKICFYWRDISIARFIRV